MTNVASKDRHVAVLPFPFSSHPGGLLSIVTRLAAAAPNVSFSFYSTSKSIETLFAPAKRVPGNIKPYVVSDGVPDGYVFSGNPLEAINLFVAAVEEGQSLKGVLKAAEAETGRRIGCVMSDAFLWFAGDLAEEMGVPWVSFWCGGANSCAAHFYTDLIRDTVGMHDIAGRKNDVVNFVPGFPELRLGDLPPEILFGNSESPFVIMLHKMGRALPKATAVFLNSFEEIVPEINQDLKYKLKMLLNVGPSNLLSSSSSPPPPPSSYSDEYGCIPWLDNFKAVSVAYIGFGTILTPSPAEIAALAEALEASGTPFLWSLKDNLKEIFPQGFMERTSKLGKIVPWAPQQQILAHSSVGVSVSHCGWNSVLESIVAGVPLIGRPFFADNLLNAWMVEKVWKIGVRLEGGVFTKNGTMLALELVLNHEKGKEMREKIGQYKELAWKAVGPEGSSTQNFNTLLECRLWFTHYRVLDYIFHSLAKRVPGNIKPYLVSDGVPEGYVFCGKPLEDINLYLEAVVEGESLKGVLNAAEAEAGRRIGCVMSDAFLWFAGDLAEEMGVPLVPVICGGADSVSAHFYTDLMRETVGNRNIILLNEAQAAWALDNLLGNDFKGSKEEVVSKILQMEIQDVERQNCRL